MSSNDQPAYVKIAFEVEDEDDPEHVDIETMWALPDDSGYRIDNIPFYAYGVAHGDIVEATPDEDGVLTFGSVVKPSGNSVVRLRFEDPKAVQGARDTLRTMGCGSELMGTSLVAVDVPASVDYAEVRRYLEKTEADGLLEYEEACLGHPEAG